MRAASVAIDYWNILWLLLIIGITYIAAYRHNGHAKTRRRIQAMELATTLVIAFVISSLLVFCLKIGIHAPRPGAVFGTRVIHSPGIEASPYGFPSGQSAFAMMLVWSFWSYVRNRPIKILMVCFVLWVGISRINLGMHFPLDVVAGYAIGAAAAWLARTTLTRLHLTLKTHH